MNNKTLTKKEQKIIEAHRGLVFSFIDKMIKSGRLEPRYRYVAISQLEYRMCLAIKKYDPNRGSITTFFYRCFFHDILRFLEKSSKHETRERSCSSIGSYCDMHHNNKYYKPVLEPDSKKIEALMCLSGLPMRSKKIVKSYYQKGLFLREIGDDLKLSKERIRQILVESISIMKRIAISYNLEFDDFFVIDHSI
jgi:RNA polymerase sigma factor (sigma-70 family)